MSISGNDRKMARDWFGDGFFRDTEAHIESLAALLAKARETPPTCSGCACYVGQCIEGCPESGRVDR